MYIDKYKYLKHHTEGKTNINMLIILLATFTENGPNAQHFLISASSKINLPDFGDLTQPLIKDYSNGIQIQILTKAPPKFFCIV